MGKAGGLESNFLYIFQQEKQPIQSISPTNHSTTKPTKLLPGEIEDSLQLSCLTPNLQHYRHFHVIRRVGFLQIVCYNSYLLPSATCVQTFAVDSARHPTQIVRRAQWRKLHRTLSPGRAVPRTPTGPPVFEQILRFSPLWALKGSLQDGPPSKDDELWTKR